MPARLLGALALIASLTLAAACDSGDNAGDASLRIEDLPREALNLSDERGDPFEGSAAEFVDQYGITPMYPTDLPRGLKLVSGGGSASPFAGSGGTTGTSVNLWYESDGGDHDGASVIQMLLAEATTHDAPTRSVDVGGVEGVIVEPPRGNVIVLSWYTCDRNITITSTSLTEDELIAMGASMECPGGTSEG